MIAGEEGKIGALVIYATREKDRSRRTALLNIRMMNEIQSRFARKLLPVRLILLNVLRNCLKRFYCFFRTLIAFIRDIERLQQTTDN